MIKTPMSITFRIEALTKSRLLDQFEEQLQPAIDGLRYFFCNDESELKDKVENTIIPELNKFLPDARQVTTISELISYHKWLFELYDKYVEIQHELRQLFDVKGDNITKDEVQHFHNITLLGINIYGCYHNLEYYI